MNSFTLEEVKAQKKADKHRRSLADYIRYRGLTFCNVCGTYSRIGNWIAFNLSIPAPDSEENPPLGLSCQDCVKSTTWIGLFAKQWNVFPLGKPYRDVCVYVIPSNRIDQELSKLSDEDKGSLWIARVEFREPMIYPDDVTPLEPLMRVVPFDGDDDPFDAPVWGGWEADHA